MKSILHILFLPAFGFISCAPKPAQDEPITRESIDRVLYDPNRMTRIGSDFISPRPNPKTDKAFAIEKSADIVVEYSTTGTMGISFNSFLKLPDGLQPTPVCGYQPKQLIRYFDSQPRKDLVVVIVAKQNWSDEWLKSEVSKLNEYFFARGYRRVVIQQGLGGGRGTHSDLQRPSKS